ncbi:helix-turn-helix domain-containing protein [Pseudidiomarina sp.]|uniref:helix-turn-helix domain-containing protein n=1 Tax=Pseudidiomarina sp. TaxID=2081707 RepID=UPI003A9779ED
MNRKRQHVFITEERKLARDFAINVGYLIQHVRASKRLDQTELAERVGTSRATISRLERFYRRKPTGPSDAERQQKWQEFERYWLGETNGY